MKKTFVLISIFSLFGNFLQATISEKVFFKNGDITLAGTLLLPKSSKPCPAVVFIHGSGQETRNNYLKEAKSWLEQGYAALVYDKRGVGKSQGDPNAWNYFSFEDLASDVAAAVLLLSERPEIDKGKIGLFAVSQGGWVAPLAAVKSGKVAFMVIMSGSVSTVSEDRVFERAARLKTEGFTEAEITEAQAMHLMDEDVTRGKQAFENFAQLWEQHKNKRWFGRYDGRSEPMDVDHPYRQWYKTVLDFDPQTYLEQLSIPVLWLYGDADLDQFCPVKLSIQRLEKLQKSGKDYEIKAYSDANHSLVIRKKELVPFMKPMFEWLASKGL